MSFESNYSFLSFCETGGMERYTSVTFIIILDVDVYINVFAEVDIILVVNSLLLDIF